MRITISFEVSEEESAALIVSLRELLGDRVQIEADAPAVVPAEGTPLGSGPVADDALPAADGPAVEVPAPAPQPPVAIPASPVEPDPAGPPGRGQIFRNPQLVGDPVVYGEWQVGPGDWLLTHTLGESRPGGETQAVRCELKRPETSFEGYDRYLSARFGNTALEMGGSFRTFHWELAQSDVPVRAGKVYDLTAVFHPLIKQRRENGAEIFMGQDVAGDWGTNLEWRWVVRTAAGQVLGADDWRDGSTLGTTSFDLPFDRPHVYTWTWKAASAEAVTFAIEFRNKWGLAMTKVWLHEATCVER